MPDRIFQSRWTEMDFGSYTASEETEKPTSPGEKNYQIEWQGDIQEMNYYAIAHER